MYTYLLLINQFLRNTAISCHVPSYNKEEYIIMIHEELCVKLWLSFGYGIISYLVQERLTIHFIAKPGM